MQRVFISSFYGYVPDRFDLIAGVPVLQEGIGTRCGRQQRGMRIGARKLEQKNRMVRIIYCI